MVSQKNVESTVHNTKTTQQTRIQAHSKHAAVYMTSICPPESNCVVQSSIIFRSWKTVDLPLIKSYCLLLRYEFSKKKCIIWSLIMDGFPSRLNCVFPV